MLTLASYSLQDIIQNYSDCLQITPWSRLCIYLRAYKPTDPSDPPTIACWAVAAPRFWNSLPEAIRQAESVGTFKMHLKTPIATTFCVSEIKSIVAYHTYLRLLRNTFQLLKTTKSSYNHWFMFFSSHTFIHQVPYQQMVLNEFTLPEFDINNFPSCYHVPT